MSATTKTVGQVTALFTTGQIAIKYRQNAQVFGVYRAHISDAYPDIALGDWVTFVAGGFRAKEIRKLEAPVAPVLKIDFNTRKLKEKQTC